jgi:FK506-binding protein 1
MGVEKFVIRSGNGTDYAKKNDEVSVEYTGEYHHLAAEANS